MTKIVKSGAVVDNRSAMGGGEILLPETGIIKRGVIPQAASRAPDPTRSRQSYTDELNRLKVDIAQAKATLRSLTRDLEDARIERESLREFLQEDHEAARTRKEQVDAMLAEARGEMEHILSAAQAEAVDIREKAKQEGYLEGFNTGYEEARQEFTEKNQPLADRIGNLTEEISGYHTRQIEENDTKLIDLIMAIVQKILHRELRQDTGVIADMLREVVEENRREDLIRITLSPDLLPVDAKASQEAKDLITGLGVNVTLITDDLLEPGSCSVETGKGITDLSISTQLNNISATLRE